MLGRLTASRSRRSLPLTAIIRGAVRSRGAARAISSTTGINGDGCSALMNTSATSSTPCHPVAPPVFGYRTGTGETFGAGFRWTAAAATMTALASLAAIGEATGGQTAHCRARQHGGGFHLGETYDVGEVLAEGSYGTVFRAHRRADGVDVALKAIDRARTSDVEFRREICALERLSEGGGHPHVCRLVDRHDDGKMFYYIAMELIEGGELFEYVQRHGAFSEAEAARLVSSLAEALLFMHSSGITHADLKPENLMLSSPEAGRAKLKVVDFGSSVTRDTKPAGSDHNAKVSDSEGTTAYMPPEMLIEGTGPTPASDMWSAGCILYVLLTGSHPFDPVGTRSDKKIKAAISKATVGPAGNSFLDANVFNERVLGLSDSCVELMRRLLHPDPALRITSDEFCRHPWMQQQKMYKILP